MRFSYLARILLSKLTINLIITDTCEAPQRHAIFMSFTFIRLLVPYNSLIRLVILLSPFAGDEIKVSVVE